MTTRIIIGDALSSLRELPDESVHCVVTSPPYWGLRDYKVEPTVFGGDPECGHDWGPVELGKRKDMLPIDVTTSVARSGTDERQDGASHNGGRFCVKCGAWLGTLGNEPTLDLHIDHLVEIFREVRRVLRKDGVLWLNYGDAYANDGKWGGSTGGKHAAGLHGQTGIGRQKVTTGLKPKDLLMMPSRVALALQADGWWLRSEIVWHKPNPMPESTTDRPTNAHEKLFLLSKSGSTLFWTHPEHPGVRSCPKPDRYWRHKETREETREEPENWRATKEWSKLNYWRGYDYYYDAVAVREVGQSGPSDIKKMAEGKERIGGKHKRLDDPLSRASSATNIGRKRSVATPGHRNHRNVWTIATAPYRGAHFATFPPDLVEPCIKAGTSEKGACAECGAPWTRTGNKTLVPTAKAAKTGVIDDRDLSADSNDGGANRQKDGHIPGWRNEFTTTGWAPTCGCDAGDPVPAVVLDCFAGAGTVGLVADQLGRSSVLIEINPDYAEMARNRIEGDAPLLSEVAAE